MLSIKLKSLLLSLIISGLAYTVGYGQEVDDSYDIIVYGGTSGGIIAAIQAARMDKEVLLIEPSSHLGGMTTGGLVWTDYGREETIGGLAAEFYTRIRQHYEQESAWKINDPHRERIMKSSQPFIISFEPRVADSVYRRMLNEAGVPLIMEERLSLEKGVTKEEDKIVAIHTESGKTYQAEMFIDTTYEGDLMALAGVSYHVGRESRDTYEESLAGVLPDDLNIRQPKRYFNKLDAHVPGSEQRGYARVDPYDEQGNILYGIQDIPLEKPGTGDDKVQAYNVRVCLTSDTSNMIPLDRPVDYDSTKYELLARYIAAHKLDNIRQVLFKIDPVPNQKTDINDGCPFSTDYIGANWDYPEANYERRAEIIADHHSFTKGLLYFIGHDPRVPQSISAEMLKYGYPKDEYVDNEHWTPQVYIRESRRMIGEYVMTQHDIEKNTTKIHPIGIGSYSLDSHHIQRLVTDEGELINEGNFTIKVDGPYEIPYETILPQQDECTNLLVPVCVSSSHVAFGSIRMEPVFMVLGQSAATAASLALESDKSLHDLDYQTLQQQLTRDQQILKID